MSEAFLLALLAKMAIAAGIVVVASLIAEHSRPLIAAMVATLPVSAGPIYVFLAIEHGSDFVGEAALGSVGSNMANAFYSLAYAATAQRSGVARSLGTALGVWLAANLAFKALALPLLPGAIATVAVFGLAHLAARPYLAAAPRVPPKRPWFAIPVRAGAVASLVGVVSIVSARVGPVWSGILATVPIVLSSLIVILQPRIGGPATAAMLANSIAGLFGFGFALMFVHLAAVRLGWPLALTGGLAICVVWNLMLVLLARRRA